MSRRRGTALALVLLGGVHVVGATRQPLLALSITGGFLALLATGGAVGLWFQASCECRLLGLVAAATTTIGLVLTLTVGLPGASAAPLGPGTLLALALAIACSLLVARPALVPAVDPQESPYAR
ncbi:hypothetical protein [Nocardioides ferulae]|uniref:hypothetical protein n=1 Tax=Nocardioides ferulae TaxID=2340821 RepID=UPI000EB2FC73|nr:hypothetical protein [Nocardioides ferulae]